MPRSAFLAPRRAVVLLDGILIGCSEPSGLTSSATW